MVQSQVDGSKQHHSKRALATVCADQVVREKDWKRRVSADSRATSKQAELSVKEISKTLHMV
jgi:hypothetical protein